MTLRPLALAFCAALIAGLTGTPVRALEPSAGSTNFTTPRSVPDYFSNESGPFRGGAAAQSIQADVAPVAMTPTPRRRVAVSSRHDTHRHQVRAAVTKGRHHLAQRQITAHRHLAAVQSAGRGSAPAAPTAQPHRAPAAGKGGAPGKAKRVAQARG